MKDGYSLDASQWVSTRMSLVTITTSTLAFLLLLFLSSCNKKDSINSSDTTQVQATEVSDEGDTLRIASFNVSMFRNSEGQLSDQMDAQGNNQAEKIAEIIQRVRPDVIALMEFDYTRHDVALKRFIANYLEVSQNEAEPIEYPYLCSIQSNTGVLSGADFDGNGNISLPNDAYGFGNFPGQYGFAILSKYPLDLENTRSFREFLWQDMPNALLPENGDGNPYYSAAALDEFRLSSKNHIDLPVLLPTGKTIHAILAHPTPPVFDGPEDRNGKRNHDEIRLIADYLFDSAYLVDDKGEGGGLNQGESFVVLGDLNADPNDGDSVNNAILQLLDHPRVNPLTAQGNLIPSSEGGAEHNAQPGHSGDPAHDSSFFGLRTDYVLVSNDLDVFASGVFWPQSSDSLAYLTANEASSDHLLVWVDLITGF